MSYCIIFILFYSLVYSNESFYCLLITYQSLIISFAAAVLILVGAVDCRKFFVRPQ